MSRKSLIVLTAALALGGFVGPSLLPPPAEAQVMQSYLPRRLTNSDLNILRAEAAKLGPDGPKEDSWTNPKTKHSGTVTFRKQVERDGMPCRDFTYTFKTGVSTDGLPYKLTWCKKPNGDWAIASK